MSLNWEKPLREGTGRVLRQGDYTPPRSEDPGSDALHLSEDGTVPLARVLVKCRISPVGANRRRTVPRGGVHAARKRPREIPQKDQNSVRGVGLAAIAAGRRWSSSRVSGVRSTLVETPAHTMRTLCRTLCSTRRTPPRRHAVSVGTCGLRAYGSVSRARLVRGSPQHGHGESGKGERMGRARAPRGPGPSDGSPGREGEKGLYRRSAPLPTNPIGGLLVRRMARGRPIRGVSGRSRPRRALVSPARRWGRASPGGPCSPAPPAGCAAG